MTITAFHPIDDGFKFSNSFQNPIISVPLLNIDIKTFGRCGGMAFLSLDYWHYNLPIPEYSALPQDGTVLADTIYARLADSMISNGFRNIDFLNMLDHPTWIRGKGAARVAREDELPKIKASIDTGRPCAIGLFRARDLGEIGNDHQVVCFGYEDGPETSALLVYDNNFPDQVARLEFSTHYVPSNRPVRHSLSGVEWRGFFLENYVPRHPWYLVEGTLLQENNGAAVQQIKAGASCWVQSPEEFDALGLHWPDVRKIGDGSLAQLDSYAADGMLVKDRDHPAIHVVFGGKPFHIPNPTEFEALGYHWDNVLSLPSGSVARMRGMPRARTLLKERSNASVYEFATNQLHHIGSPAIFESLEFSWDNVRVVPDGSFAAFSIGGPVS